MRRTERLIASLLPVALLGMIAAPPALASREPKPDPRCGFVSLSGRLNLNARGLLNHYPKAQADTVLIVKRDGTLLNGYPITFKSDTHTPHFTTAGHYVAKFKTEAGAIKVSCEGTLSPGDTTPPVLTLPADITVDAPGSSSVVVVNYTASATDSGGSVAVSCSPPSGSAFSVGTTIVFCSATDASGNSSHGTFLVTVRDVTPPVVTVPPDITVDATGPGGAVVNFTATSTDASGPVFPSCIPGSGSTFAAGTTTVTCTASDPSGNISFATFLVTVRDVTPPVLTLPADITVPATGPSGAVVAFTVTASDDGGVSLFCIPGSGDTFAVGTTTVTCTASDPSGNTTFGSFTVTVTEP